MCGGSEWMLPVNGRKPDGVDYTRGACRALVGAVTAGFPSPAEEELTDTLSLDEYLITNREATYILRVNGESMI